MTTRSRRGLAAPPSWASPGGIGLLVGLFALLVGLVEAGAFSRIDQYAIDHIMPPLTPGAQSWISLRGLYDPFGSGTPWWQKILDLWCYPCSVLVSALVVAGVVVVAARRGRLSRALVVAVAWGIGNLVELVGKELIRRPALYATSPAGVRFHELAFDNSFPSGHMIRGMMVAAALLVVLPGWRRALVAWCTLVGVFLVLTAAHTPSDVLGGLVVGLVLIGGARLATAALPHELRLRLRAVASARGRGATAP